MLAAVVLIASAVFVYIGMQRSLAPASVQQAATPTPIATAAYVCDGGKTIAAQYYQGTTAPPVRADEPPVPGGSVDIQLSAGRSMHLAQTISAYGARYANSDESFIFWSKGDGAIILVNGQPKDYTGCIVVKPDPGNLPQLFESGSQGFSLRYPAGFTVDKKYTYQELGPGKDISGVKFTIDPAIASSTNLSTDSYISVEQIPRVQACSASLFLDQGAKAGTATIDGIEYSVASSTGAGAGNRYEESIFALPGTNPCIAVRYLIHYGVIENYPAGAVQEFDHASLVATFDAVRDTLTIVQ